MIDLIAILQNQDNLNEHLNYLKKAKFIDPKMKPIKKFIDDISSKSTTKNLYLNSHNKKILENLVRVFEKNKNKISKGLYDTFHHEYGHMYIALASGFGFSAIILNAHTKLHIFYLENESSTKVLYHSSKKIIPTIIRSSRGVAIFSYKDYLNDQDIHYKLSLTAISGYIAQQFYLNGYSDKTQREQSKILLRSFGIKRSFNLIPIKYFFKRIVNNGSDADLIVNHINSSESIETQTEIDFINELNNVHDTLYHNSGNIENYGIYHIKDISKEIQKFMSITSK